jgi:hypothetical protein
MVPLPSGAAATGERGIMPDVERGTNLALTDEQAALLLKELDRIIEHDHYRSHRGPAG